MKKLWGFFEQAFTVLSLLHYSGGPLVLILMGGQSEGEALVQDFDSIPVRILFIIIYAITLLLLIARWKKVIYLLRKDKFIWSLVAIAVCSIFWSYDPATTQTRAIGLVGTSLFGIYLATRYTLKEQLELLAWTFGLAVILSLMFSVALPKYGVMGGVHAGAWRGIYPHKNSCGIIMMLSSLVFLLLAIDKKEKSLPLWLGFGLSIIMLLMTRSTSSLLNFGNMMFAFFFFRGLRLRLDMMIPALCFFGSIFASLFIILQSNSDSILASFGKGSNLSGRTDLWLAVLDMIWKKPLLGYGYGAFWLGENSEAVNVWYAVGWKAPYAHNGWLDIWLTVGILGLVLCALGFTFSLIRSLIWVSQTKTVDAFWPGIYITYIFLANMTETTFMVQNDISWVLYVAVGLTVLLPPKNHNQQLNKHKLTAT
ncbi:O-antigen polymerase [Tolypothrix tenuis PCC 7101]|uniref:O-antigen polymerase n=1 Tax=Tolypothrix tenuis PCC 7101 TaxID=231146 RepID=A0A1Z4MSN8_9CYAN|nr:O-antigen ligase family protein [Aulosira sp. FACHB-113]BAY96480.1 O-antigen polymerase [Tolypothrix tenuis PCC 7101]BAZ73014.1 O-antigen polymerase [Aulosira laxa NIES-50]